MKTILVDAVYSLIDLEWNINLEMQKLLDSFENRKIILTNADYEKNNKFNLLNMPYSVFILKHNSNKTNSEFYKIFLEKYNLNSDDVIYFEHNLEAVESAMSVWIKTFYYDKDKKNLTWLEKFLKENI